MSLIVTLNVGIATYFLTRQESEPATSQGRNLGSTADTTAGDGSVQNSADISVSASEMRPLLSVGLPQQTVAGKPYSVSLNCVGTEGQKCRVIISYADGRAQDLGLKPLTNHIQRKL